MNAKREGFYSYFSPSHHFACMIIPYSRVTGAPRRYDTVSEKLELPGEYLRRKEKNSLHSKKLCCHVIGCDESARIPAWLFAGWFCSRAWLPSLPYL